MTGEAHDAALVSLAANGDGDAFALLYRRYRLNVWDLSYYLCLRNHHDAEEAMQETFLKAWRSLRRYRAAGTFKSWLLTICRNVCIDRVHRVPIKPVPLDACGEHEIVDRSYSPDAVERILLRATLADLPRDECEAWFLVDVLGCSSREAARIVGARAASTVRSRVTRARLQIAEALSGDAYSVLPGACDTNICGLYHLPPDKAIVVALTDPGRPRTHGAPLGSCAPGTPVSSWRTVASAAGHQGSAATRLPVDDTTGVPAAPNRSRRLRSEIREGVDLIDFFDELDGNVPWGTRVVAIVDSPAAATAHWCDAHPHWELLHAPAHRAWREEAERLLARCLPCPAQQSATRALALLDPDKPFIRTYNRSGAAL